MGNDDNLWLCTQKSIKEIKRNCLLFLEEEERENKYTWEWREICSENWDFSFRLCLDWGGDVWGFEVVDMWGKCECLDWGMLGWMCEESWWEFVSDVMIMREF